MKLTANIKRLIKRKLTTAMLILASVAAFATLGDGGKKKSSTFNSGKAGVKTFSLRTNYNYRGNNFFTVNKPVKFMMQNTVVTYQKGNATYIVPLKKKVILDKIKFNPAASKF